jgi:hypothetical protein
MTTFEFTFFVFLVGAFLGALIAGVWNIDQELTKIRKILEREK